MTAFFEDLRFAMRTFAKRPGFAITAALTLALGIGAATSVFSIVDAVLLRPLPYRDSDRLVAVWARNSRDPGSAPIFATYSHFDEFRRKSRSLENIAAATWAGPTARILTGRGPAREVLTIPASASFFQTLGVGAELGRTFTAEDELHGCSVVLAHEFWQSVTGADRGIAGQKLVLNQEPCTVLGVMPQSFRFFPRPTAMWILLGPPSTRLQQLGVGIFARLKPGVTTQQAQTELTGLHRALFASGIWRDFEPLVKPLHGEFTFLASRTLRTTLIVLFAAVCFVLLIACLNVANLLLARLSERYGELAVRAALGSSKSRLVRQVLTESLLLSWTATALGVAFTYAAVRVFQSVNPIDLGVGADVQVNLPVLLFSGGLSVVTVLVFGLIPALRASRIDIVSRLKAGARGVHGASHRPAKILAGVEVALTFVLLIGTGLVAASALNMGAENLGFDPRGVVTTGVTLPRAAYAAGQTKVDFYESLLTRAGQDVASVALASRIPPNTGETHVIEIQGRDAPQTPTPDVGTEAVSSRFFEVLQISVERGRGFDSRDRPTSQPVAVVNQSFATHYFPGADPIGKLVRFNNDPQNRSPENPSPWMAIVGVIANVKSTELMNEMKWVELPTLYRPVTQDPRAAMQIVARLGPGINAEELRRRLMSVNPEVPVREAEPLASGISAALAYPRFRASILTLFSIAALLLSAVGLHGVLAQLVQQRTSEFGIRRAIGAQTRDLILLIARQGGIPVLTGAAAGLACAVGFSRILGSLLYGIEPTDPRMLAAVLGVVLLAGAFGAAVPALRAARVDPMTALRND